MYGYGLNSSIVAYGLKTNSSLVSYGLKTNSSIESMAGFPSNSKIQNLAQQSVNTRAFPSVENFLLIKGGVGNSCGIKR